jgi:hypothetical protein
MSSATMMAAMCAFSNSKACNINMTEKKLGILLSVPKQAPA